MREGRPVVGNIQGQDRMPPSTEEEGKCRDGNKNKINTRELQSK